MVYFIHNPLNNCVKIGRSIQVTTHLATLRNHCGIDLILLGVVQTDNDKLLEAQLHRQFAAQRTRGEWFTLNPDLETYIKENATDYSEATAEWKTVRLPEELYSWLQQHKEKTGIPIATAVKIAVTQYKERH